MADMGKIGSSKAPSSVWSGSNPPKDGRSADDNKTAWNVGETIAARKPINMSNHERSPLS